MMSTPASIMVEIAVMDVALSGKPAGQYPTRAARLSRDAWVKRVAIARGSRRIPELAVDVIVHHLNRRARTIEPPYAYLYRPAPIGSPESWHQAPFRRQVAARRP